MWVSVRNPLWQQNWLNIFKKPSVSIFAHMTCITGSHCQKTFDMSETHCPMDWHVFCLIFTIWKHCLQVKTLFDFFAKFQKILNDMSWSVQKMAATHAHPNGLKLLNDHGKCVTKHLSQTAKKTFECCSWGFVVQWLSIRKSEKIISHKLFVSTVEIHWEMSTGFHQHIRSLNDSKVVVVKWGGVIVLWHEAIATQLSPLWLWAEHRFKVNTTSTHPQHPQSSASHNTTNDVLVSANCSNVSAIPWKHFQQLIWVHTFCTQSYSQIFSNLCQTPTESHNIYLNRGCCCLSSSRSIEQTNCVTRTTRHITEFGIV